MIGVVRGAAILVAATVAAFGSSWIERHGPDQAVFCALGKSVDGHDIYCPRPVLNGGWPAPYLVDRTGISVENQLSFFEDDFRQGPFTANVAFYAWIATMLGLAMRRFRA